HSVLSHSHRLSRTPIQNQGSSKHLPACRSRHTQVRSSAVSFQHLLTNPRHCDHHRGRGPSEATPRLLVQSNHALMLHSVSEHRLCERFLCLIRVGRSIRLPAFPRRELSDTPSTP